MMRVEMSFIAMISLAFSSYSGGSVQVAAAASGFYCACILDDVIYM